jgi:hypothetical protein
LSRSGRDRTPEAPLAVNEEISPLEEKPPLGIESGSQVRLEVLLI